MTEEHLVKKKLALVDTYVAQLRNLARLDDLERDVRERRFVEHTLQLAIQACLDVASHIVSSDRLGEPKTNRALFVTLASAGWIDDPLASTMSQVAGFRNILVHGYADVDLAVVRDVVENRLDDLLEYVGMVRDRLRSGA